MSRESKAVIPTDLFGNAVVETHKICSTCRAAKPLHEFRAKEGCLYGRNTTCYDCDREYQINRYKQDNGYRARTILWAKEKYCNERGLPYDLDVPWMVEKLEEGRCEVTGLPFDTERGDQYKNNYTPSLDRLRADKGYTKDNVRLVLWMYNAAKAEGTDADVLNMAFALVRRAVLAEQQKQQAA